MLKRATLLIFSPSRMLVEHLRDRCDKDPEKRGLLFRRWNAAFFFAEVLLALSLGIVTVFWPALIPDAITLLLLLYSWSRVNEIVIAFYNDAFSHLHKEPMATNLTPADRVSMALRSYVGLAVNFGIFYFFIPVSCKFHGQLSNFGDALYFSFVTITTLGYGDISPSQALVKGLTVYEVLAGLLVAVVAVATYIGGPSEPRA